MAKILLCLLMVFSSGCAKLALLPYMDQALVLEDFGKEKTAQHKYVEDVNAKYDKLLLVVKSGDIAKYKTEKGVIKEFGPPLLVKTVSIDGKDVRQCLYRKAVWRMAKDKVYLYYDTSGQLIKWESRPASLFS